MKEKVIEVRPSSVIVEVNGEYFEKPIRDFAERQKERGLTPEEFDRLTK